MKRIMVVLAFLVAGWNSADAQSHPQEKRVYEPIVSIGLGQSNSKINWAFFQLGLRTGSDALLIGASHRIPYDADGGNVFYAGRNFRPWLLGGKLEYRRYLPVVSRRFAPFAMAGMMVSGYDVWVNPPFFTHSYFAGRQFNFEPKVGIGFNWKFGEFFSLLVQGGGGVDVGKFFEFEGKGYTYTDLGFNGMVGLERRF